MRKIRDYEKYIRYEFFPSTWCPGCADGIILKSIAMVLSDMEIDPDDVVVVSGIGCSGRMPNYFNTNSLHTAHGRAPAFATGIKLSRPDKTVVVITGDGDAAAIGGNHLIHAARRNIGIKLIIINNGIYGMTGGQVSPTTPQGFFTETTTYGNFEPNFDFVETLRGANASFVARESIKRLPQLKKIIRKSFEHNGFSAVEVLSNCHVILGARNKMRSAISMMDYIESISYPMEKAGKMPDEEKKGKFPLGVFVDRNDMMEYADMYYNKLVPIAQGKG
jgi:2-oxoglutarate ferredoxin oxidoreductase subunit beta